MVSADGEIRRLSGGFWVSGNPQIEQAVMGTIRSKAKLSARRGAMCNRASDGKTRLGGAHKTRAAGLA